MFGNSLLLSHPRQTTPLSLHLPQTMETTDMLQQVSKSITFSFFIPFFRAYSCVEACPLAQKKSGAPSKSYLKRGTAKNPCRNMEREYAAWLPRSAPPYFTSTQKISGFSLEATIRCCVRCPGPGWDSRTPSPRPNVQPGQRFWPDGGRGATRPTSPIGECSWAHPPF